MAVPVEVLTDEELEVLDGPPELVVHPHLSTLDEAERRTAWRTAYRGLLARGVVEPPGPAALASAGPDGDVEVAVREDVAALVTARRTAPAVLCAARTTSAGLDYWYAHVLGDAVLLEQVSADGLHRFAATTSAHLPDLLVAALVHPEAVDGAGAAATLTDPADPPAGVLDALGAATLRSDLVLRTPHDDRPTLTGLFSGPRGTWVLTSRLGDARPVTLRPVSRTAAQEHLRTVAATAVAAAGIPS